MRRLFAALVLTAGFATMGCSDGGPEPSTAGADGIREGSNASEPWVVRVQEVVGGVDGSMCTGVVVTPAYVMTAAHCFRLGWGLNPSRLSIRSDDLGEVEINSYTPGFLGSEHVARLWGSGNVEADYGATRQDIALIPLDKLMPEPHSETVFPLSLVAARDDFDGKYFGFGNGEILVGQFPSAAPLGVRKRVGVGPITRKNGFLAREFEAVGTTFVGQIPGLGDLVNFLNGNTNVQVLEKGDSGGPLIDAAGGDHFGVSGINSRVYPDFDCGVEFQFGFPPVRADCRIEVENHHADASRADARSWYNPILFGPNGRLKGVCSYPGLPPTSADQDGDTIPDPCDPCPHVFDANYDTSDSPDTDDDGLPDRCDICPTVADGLTGPRGNQRQPDNDGDGVGDTCDPCFSAPVGGNCNLEAELLVGYAGLGLAEPPIIYSAASRNPFDESREDAIRRYQQTFRGDGCDIAPCPRFGRGAASVPPDRLSGPECLLLPTSEGLQEMCTVGAGTRLRHQPQPSSLTGGRLGTVHMKWCSCPTDGDRTTLEERARCERLHDCRGTQSRFNDTAHWFDIRTAPDAGLLSSAYDAAETGSFIIQDYGSGTPRERVWDYLALGSPFVEANGTVRGVLWNNVRSVVGVTPSQIDTIQQRGSAFDSGDAAFGREPRGTSFGPEPFPPFDPRTDLPAPCWSCPFGWGNWVDVLVQRPNVPVGTLLPEPLPIGPRGPQALGDLNGGRAFTDDVARILRNSDPNLLPVVQSEPPLFVRSQRPSGATSDGVLVSVGAPGIAAGVRVLSALTRPSQGASLGLASIVPGTRERLFPGLAGFQGFRPPVSRRRCGEVELTARRSYSPSVFSDASYRAPTRRKFAVPEVLEVLAGNGGNGLAALTVGDSVTGFEARCEYRAQAGVAHPVDRELVRAGMFYQLESCTPALTAGQSVTADHMSLRVESADGTLPMTMVRAEAFEQQPCTADEIIPDVTVSSASSNSGVGGCQSVELVSYSRRKAPEPIIPRQPPGTRINISGPANPQPEEVPGQQRLVRAARFILPEVVAAPSGVTFGAELTLSFQNGEAAAPVRCEYRASQPRNAWHRHRGWNSSPKEFRLKSCDAGLEAGDVFQADVLSLSVARPGHGQNPIVASLALEEIAPCGASVGPEKIFDREGVVYSASRQEVYLFGGLPQRFGGPRTSAWTYSLARDEWVETALDPEHRPGDVIAAAYRLEDGFVYVVDRVFGKERVRRWDGRERSFATVATLPSDWQDARFDRRWLVPAPNGDLLLVGTTDGLSVLLRIGFLSDGRATTRGTMRIHRQTRARPIAGETGVNVSTPTRVDGRDTVVQMHLRFEDFDRHDRRWALREGHW
jgi:hypothetical protein